MVQDKRRDPNTVKENRKREDAKPERQEKKKKYREDNPDIVAQWAIDGRGRDIAKHGVVAFRAKMAKQSQDHRDKSPEEVEKYKNDRRTSYECQYKRSKSDAESKTTVFSITQDEFISIVNTPCHYCGIVEERGEGVAFNGLGRENHSVGFVLNNCLSRCTTCLYLKKSLGRISFVRRVEHILTFHGIIAGTLFPEEFPDHCSGSQSTYESSASSKDKGFLITNDEFDTIIAQDCYLCGKSNSNTHTNGIDRYDNDKGYEMPNCRSCCGECNYMKRAYKHDEVIEQFKLIYANNKCIDLGAKAHDNISLVRSNTKKPKGQIEKERSANEEKRTEALCLKYDVAKHSAKMQNNSA
jgi:hypothetical protein